MSEAAVSGFSRLLSDERLTQRAVGGDDRAFAAIFRRYHQSLYRFCLAIVGNPDDAQDALQNTMTKVLRALPGEERKIELKPWLYRIAHNESIDLLRRRRETRQLDVEQVAPGYGLAEDAATRERLRRLLADLRELPERQREVLVMRELSGFDFEEIGAALDTSGAVARQTLYEARQSLRQMEAGREMSCDAVAKALSDGDGRVTRRRDVRAHLRSCAECRAFRDEIQSRQHDLAALSPLPAIAAAGMLQGLLGGSQGAATGGGLAATLGGGAAKTIGASAAAKGVATAAVVAAIGVTAADQTGVIHLGLPGEQKAKPVRSAPQAPGAGSAAAQQASGRSEGRRGSGRSHGETAPAGGVEGSAKQAHATVPAGNAGAEHQAAAAEHAYGHEHQPAKEEVSSQGQGPPAEHPAAPGHDKQQSEVATDGGEAAETRKPPREPSAGDEGGEESLQADPPKPSHPTTPAPAPAPSPPRESPEGASIPVNPPVPASETQAPAADPSPGKGSSEGTPGSGKAAEKRP